ncbi:AfsR/SARP family transcriptional regulator [Nonomuraea glycinis]|uniref:AfsR/SARP family transcriptional regulator n=1 Tax=Nonomuraea glycinis TaxID=2047744 RepID=UPI0033AFAB3C
MYFRVLGPLSVNEGTRDVTPRTPKLQALLALLLFRRGEVVHVRESIDELWGERPPNSAASTLHTYVYKLRRTVLGDDLLLTRPNGYQLDIPVASLDLSRFDWLIEEGKADLAAGDLRSAVSALDSALSLWRGDVLAGLAKGRSLSAQLTRLEERRLDALECRADARLGLGCSEQVVDEMKLLLAENPLNESFTAKLMKALRQAGRIGDAERVYSRLRSRLLDDLGLEPSSTLQDAYREMLHEPRRPAVTGPGTPGPVMSLPPDPPHFVGRSTAAGEIERLLTSRGESRPATEIVSITGPSGSGKTALSIRMAHKLRGLFPGGVHFLSLRGSQARPADPVEVFGGILASFGVPRGEVPGELAECGNAYRTLTAERGCLIVIDDVDCAARAREFIPGCPKNAVIVTSRRQMPALAGAHVVELGPLDRAEGARLLSMIVGRRRVEDATADAARIVRLCEYLPLTIRGAAAALRSAPSMSLAEYADRLARSGRRLSELSSVDVDVRGGYDVDYRRLGQRGRDVLGRLSSSHLTGFTAQQVSRLLGWSVPRTEAVMIQLLEHCFVRVSGRDPSGDLHYAFAPLTRLYLRERALEESGSTAA